MDAFFAAVPGVVAGHENAFSNTYVARLFPTYRVEPEIVARARTLAAAEGDRLPALRRLLLEAGRRPGASGHLSSRSGGLTAA